MSNVLTFSDVELEKSVYLEASQTTSKVFLLDSSKMWVKRSAKSGSNLLHHIAYKLFKIEILTPAQNKSDVETMVFEVSKLKAIKEKFPFVPDVIGANRDFMVIGDCGKSLLKIVQENLHNQIDSTELLKSALTTLASFHNCSFYHGGSQIKNMTLKDDQIYLLDFEESFDDKYDLKTLQFRDLFLFFISIAKSGVEINYKEFIENYILMSGNDDFRDRFALLAKKISPLIKVLDIESIYNMMDKDTVSVYKFFKSLCF